MRVQPPPAAAQIATHAALVDTHGVSGTIADISDITADIATHAALTETHGVSGGGTIAELADIATHAALTTGTHGVSGTIVGTSDSQGLTNKWFGAGGLTIENVGAGDNIVFTSDHGAQVLNMTGSLALSKNLNAEENVQFKSSTAFLAVLQHTLTAQRAIVFPDLSGTVILEEDTGRSLSLAQLTIENAGAGTDPVLACDSAGNSLALTGSLEASAYLQWKVNTAYTASLIHAISNHRDYTFPNKNITVAGVDDIATHAGLTASHGVAGTIADTADITTAVSTHAALTATHGVSGTIADAADLTTHAALTATHGVAEVADVEQHVTQQLQLAHFESSDGSPSLQSASGTDTALSHWRTTASDTHRIRSKECYYAPKNATQLKIAIVASKTSDPVVTVSYSREAGAVTQLGDALVVTTGRTRLESSAALGVDNNDGVRIFVTSVNDGDDLCDIYAIHLIWS